MSKYSTNDIYCDLIIPKKISVDIIKETEEVIAFYHTKPHWQVHVVVTLKQHIPSLLELNGLQATKLLDVVKEVAKLISETYGACSITTNLGNYQDSKHLHVHLRYGRVTSTETNSDST